MAGGPIVVLPAPLNFETADMRQCFARLPLKKQTRVRIYENRVRALSDELLAEDIRPLHSKFLKNSIKSPDALKLSVAFAEWRRRDKTTAKLYSAV